MNPHFLCFSLFKLSYKTWNSACVHRTQGHSYFHFKTYNALVILQSCGYQETIPSLQPQRQHKSDKQNSSYLPNMRQPIYYQFSNLLNTHDPEYISWQTCSVSRHTNNTMPYVELFKDLYIDIFLTGCNKWDQAKLCWKKTPKVEVTKGEVELRPKIFQWTNAWSFIAQSHSQTQELPSHFERIHYASLCCDLLTQHLLPTLSSYYWQIRLLCFYL
jgi:hypothetical protein